MTLAAANAIRKNQIFGSIGYLRGDNTYDDYDYFSCQVAQGGTLSVEVLPASTLYSFNNGISIRNANNTAINYGYLTTSPVTVTVNDLDAGTYYIRISRAVGYGAYQINVSGNVILPVNPAPGIFLPLLLSQ